MNLKLEEIPYFAIAGLVLLVSMLLYTTTSAGFWTYIVPTYLTEALLFFVLGFAFWKSFKKSGFTVFIMVLLWIFNQILNWSGLYGVGNTLTVGTWFVLIAQIVLTILFFADYPIKYFDFQSDAWPYASGFVLLLFGGAKMYLDYSYGTPIMMFLWGLGISLVSFGYIIRPKAKEYSAGIQIVGLLLVVVAAFAIAGPGLMLV